MTPKISCIVPVFNDCNRMPKAVASALRQLPDVQVIVVDDGSDDGSAEVALDLARSDPRVIAIALRSNMGQAMARNVGLARAEGRLVTFLDSDDEHADGFYAHAIEVLQAGPDLAAVRGHIELVHPDGTPIALGRDDPKYALMLASSASTFVVDRQIAAAIGFPAGRRFRWGSEDIVFTHTVLNEFRVAQLGSVALRVLVKAGGHTAHFLHGTPVSGMPDLDHARLKEINEAVALETAERRLGIEAFDRRRDPKR
jgi:glycosyltransferase involved in cell wall biosynthesis